MAYLVYKGKKKVRLTLNPYLYESVYFRVFHYPFFRTLAPDDRRIAGKRILLTQNPIQMEKMHSFKFKVSESTVLTFVTAFLYFCAIMAFAYLFTMS